MLTFEKYNMVYNALTALETSTELQSNLIRMIIEAMDKIIMDDLIMPETCGEYAKIRLKLEELHDDHEHIGRSVILLKAILLQFFNPEKESVCSSETIS